MLSRIPFAAKAGVGMLVFALAPCYCVYALSNAEKHDEDEKARRREKLQRQLRVDNPFARAAAPDAAASPEHGQQ